jgi:hypothetical protein
MDLLIVQTLLLSFNTARLNVLIALVIAGLLVFYFIREAKKKGALYLRPISGLTAIEEAVGRATEMGKAVLYTTGLGKMERVATIASMNILGNVARKVASYGTPLIIPCYDPVVMAVAQEVVKESFAKEGKSEAYRPENIYFVTQSQFGYAAAVDGVMVREKPAANLFLGTFEAESLILAETGNSIGAIQIAGTDSTIQLSFFIVACDYTLIGEELFAASGYLSGDPKITGSIKAQDWLKVLITLAIILGVIFSTMGLDFWSNLFSLK